jgi:hypothetical protein
MLDLGKGANVERIREAAPGRDHSRFWVISAVFAMSEPRPVYLRLRKDCGVAANRR